ncbi:hypothetical protein GCM10022631_34050 [Deinococcus rubellus]|uniref:Glycosyltransferase family 1 protein n=1 Tax=Deinococcus rubellus TaxID=1889240 RepID=A0ABY5YDF7_9DEIO|nr:hypothetical protein [Deinococcus rubellus]UWX63110.1 hypothetical protein N0D28_10095 [Deinococcus rubellus]
MKKKKIIFFGQAWAEKISKSVSPYTDNQIENCVIIGPISLLRLIKFAIVGDILVRVGFRPGSPSFRGRLIDLLTSCIMFTKPRLKLFFYWIGTDVTDAINDAREEKNTIFFKLLIKHRHISGGTNLTDELKIIGINSTTLPIPLKFPPELSGIERSWGGKRMTVLTYIPDFRHEFYGGEMIFGAAKALPEIEFIVMGGEGSWLKESIENLQFVGWVENPREYYIKSTHVARLVQHDSLGATVLEGLWFGRQVIYTRAVEGVIEVKFGDTNNFIKILDEERSKLDTSGFKFNDEGVNVVRQRGNERFFAKNILSELNI